MAVSARQQLAIEELTEKTLFDIHAETARTWAYRAWAATQMGLREDPTEYAHEAIEHAALSGDDALLAEVRAIILGKP